MKFELSISHRKISSLDTLIYKDKNNTFQASIDKKPADQQSYFHIDLDHAKLIKAHLNSSDTSKES